MNRDNMDTTYWDRDRERREAMRDRVWEPRELEIRGRRDRDDGNGGAGGGGWSATFPGLGDREVSLNRLPPLNPIRPSWEVPSSNASYPPHQKSLYPQPAPPGINPYHRQSGSLSGAGYGGGQGGQVEPTSPTTESITASQTSPSASASISYKNKFPPFSPAEDRERDRDRERDKDGEAERRNKPKKRRVALSCAECSKRKQKCNRETPCQHCVARRVPELCVPYTRDASPPRTTHIIRTKPEIGNGDTSTSGPGIGSGAVGGGTAPKAPGALPTLTVRVARIEALLNVVINKVDGIEGKALSDWRINHAPEIEPSPPAIRSVPMSRAITKSSTHTTRSAEETDDLSKLDQVSVVRNPLPQSMLKRTQPMSSNLELSLSRSKLKEVLDSYELDRAQQLISDLPEATRGKQLCDLYFTKFDYFRYPIHRPFFTKHLDNLYSGDQPQLSAENLLFLPLMYIAIAIGVRLDESLPEEERKINSRKYHKNAVAAMSLATNIKAETSLFIEAKILRGLYLVLMHQRRLAEGWAEFRSAIAMAQVLGMHRDGSKIRLDRPTTEYWRRLWSYLVHADATYSCLLGRPLCIDLACCDTLPPANIALKDTVADPKAVEHPMSETTFATYLILRRGLGEIVAKMTRHFQRVKPQTSPGGHFRNPYRDVEELDTELQTFTHNLPPAFRMVDPDKSKDAEIWYLPLHRYYITTEILHYRIILHRPWILRRLDSNKYALSRLACFESAIQDFRIRQDKPEFLETLLAGSFREFNVAMIAGISLALEPRSSHAKDMRAILDSFMEHYPYDPTSDDFSKKEAAIIHTLHQRAQRAQEGLPVSSPPRSRHRRGSKNGLSTDMGISRSGGPTRPISSSRDETPIVPTTATRDTAPIITGWQQAEGEAVARNSADISPATDDDKPQQLLNHWIMANQSFAPLASTTNQANIGLGITTETLFTNPLDQSQTAPMTDWTTSVPQPLIVGQDQDFQNGLTVPTAQPGGMSWNAGGLTGFESWGDGNDPQFWNAIIDGAQNAQHTMDYPMESTFA